MELNWVLPGVAPDGSCVHMSCILGQIIQTNTLTPQEGKPRAPASVPSNLTRRVLDVKTCPFTEHRDDGVIDERCAHTQVLVAEQVIHLLTIFPIYKLPL